MSSTASSDTAPDTWEAFWAEVGSEEWLAAKAILEADPRRTVARDLAQWIKPNRYGGLDLDWEGWLTSVDWHGRGWSSTESRQYRIAASLLDSNRTISIPRDLDLGSWERDILAALVNYVSGGNNRDRAGRHSLAGGRP